MVEQDYYLRIINEAVRMAMKLIFHVDMEAPTTAIFEASREKDELDDIIALARKGYICDAEDRLYDQIVDQTNIETLQMCLVFYSELNQLSSDFLDDHDFSREEVRDGVKEILLRYGFEDMLGMFSLDDY